MPAYDRAPLRDSLPKKPLAVPRLCTGSHHSRWEQSELKIRKSPISSALLSGMGDGWNRNL